MDASVGKEVLLSDGRKANIIMINSQNFTNPLVKIGNDFIDLQLEQDVHIEKIIG